MDNKSDDAVIPAMRESSVETAHGIIPTCVLSLDQATKCGWALSVNGAIESGVWDLSASRFQSEGMRLIKLRSSLNQIKEAYPELKLVIFEEVRFSRFADATAVHNQLTAVVKVWCMDNKIDYTAIPVGTVKKVATGKGNASKEQMLAAAHHKWPLVAFADDNEADARWILVAGLHELGQQMAKTVETVGTVGTVGTGEGATLVAQKPRKKRKSKSVQTEMQPV